MDNLIDCPAQKDQLSMEGSTSGQCASERNRTEEEDAALQIEESSQCPHLTASSSQPDHSLMALNHVYAMDEKHIDTNHFNSMDGKDEVKNSKKSDVELLIAGSTNLVENHSSRAAENSPHVKLMDLPINDSDAMSTPDATSAVKRRQHELMSPLHENSPSKRHNLQCASSSSPSNELDHDNLNILDGSPSSQRGMKSPSAPMAPQMKLIGTSQETANILKTSSRHMSPCIGAFSACEMVTEEASGKLLKSSGNHRSSNHNLERKQLCQPERKSSLLSVWTRHAQLGPVADKTQFPPQQQLPPQQQPPPQPSQSHNGEAQ